MSVKVIILMLACFYFLNVSGNAEPKKKNKPWPSLSSLTFEGKGEEINYNQSLAFRSWLNSVLLTYDNRVRPYFGVRKLKIRLGLKLIGISSISETDMSFSVEMFFHESWIDDRLRFEPGTFGTRYPITLPLDAPRLLWTPDTSFLNALRSEVPEPGSVSHLYSMMLYPNGTIGYSRRLSVTAQCLMDLTMYPFDRQACTLELSSYGWTNDDIVYEWMRKEIPIKGLSLADFDAKDSRLKVITKSYSAGNFSVPTLCVALHRRSGFCFLQLFIPATAVVISSWISLWLDNETQFTDLVSVILAIIFLSYSYNTVMPKVSYVKAMDIYLLACFIFVFCSLVKLAIVKYMRTVVHKRKEKHAAAQAAAPPPPIAVDDPAILPEVSEVSEVSEVDEPTKDLLNLIVDPVFSTQTGEETDLEPMPLLATTDAYAPMMMSTTTATVTSSMCQPMMCEAIPIYADVDPNANASPNARARRAFLRFPYWQRFHHPNDDSGQEQAEAEKQAEKEAKKKQKVKRRRRLMNRLAVQQAAITQRVMQMRWMTGAHLLHLPSLHDNYWRCMKAFHLGSQLVLPLAFGAFAVFYFFIYPNVRTNQGECN